jgi:hypothetical protein
MELSRNAGKLARAAGKEGMTADDIATAAAAAIHGNAKMKLLELLDEAISATEEFNIGEFTGPLHKCFNAKDIITYTRNGALINAKEFAGSYEDLRAGIDAARAELGIGKTLSIIDASRFWKWRIYKPAREGEIPKTFSVYKYKTKLSREKTKERKENQTEKLLAYAKEKYKLTITARKRGWQLAPYWLLIDNGNKINNMTGGHPYPEVKPQRFTYKAKQAINILYRDAMVAEIEKYAKDLSEEVLEFLYNPKSARPGTALGKVKARGNRVRDLFVTRAGLLGYRTVEE